MQLQTIQQQRVSNCVFALDPKHMRIASSWTAFLTNLWRQFVGNDREDADAAALGRELIDIVCLFSQSLYSVRRKALSNDRHFLARDRDPPGAGPQQID
jgi:predicted site-specific integrase-resolvase